MPPVITASALSKRAAHFAGDGYGAGARPDWRKVDWRAHLHQIELRGTTVNYVDLGEASAPPVVFVHGLGGCWQNWIENLPRVAEERRAIALDLPGFGRSEMPRDEISISGFARYLDALCEQLGLGPVAVVGNSMGGFVGAEVAIRYPERAERLVLVSPAGISTADLQRRPVLTAGRVLAAVSAYYTPARLRWLASRPMGRQLTLAMVARHPSLLKGDLVYEGFFRGLGAPGFQDALKACLVYDYRERLPEIGAPALIVWGEDDPLIPVRDADEYERRIPDSRKLLMKETGHVAMAERPEAFNRELLEFLSEVGEAQERAEEVA